MLNKNKKLMIVFICFFVLCGVLGGVLGNNREVKALYSQTTFDSPRIREWFKKLKEKYKEGAMTKTGVLALQSAAENFSRQMAYKIATGIAQGGKGGEALNFKLPMGEYLEQAAGAAVGDFLGSISKMWGVDFCDPGDLLKADLTIKLFQNIYKPPKPKCDWNDIKGNWKKIKDLDEGEYLKQLSMSFEPNVSYLATGIEINKKIEEEVKKAKEKAEKERGLKQDEGFKDKKATISGNIETPQAAVAELNKLPVVEDRENRKVKALISGFNASVISPFTQTFFSTLTGKLMKKWLSKGMFPDTFHKTTAHNIFNPESKGGNKVSTESIDQFYANVMKPKYYYGGNYDIVSELASCPFPDNPGPINCIIDNSFRMAIDGKMTVGNAIKKGNLHKDWAFGFNSADKEPPYNGGYPFRSMKILRRYRILPVGWEIASEYINNYSNKFPYTLEQLVDCYSDTDEWDRTDTKEEWCRGLVDPDWLLKAPANDCEKRAYGQEILSENFLPGTDLNKDTDYRDDGEVPPHRLVTRNESCVIDKSCIKESPNGKCLQWGYCTEENRIWQFNGEDCSDKFNTCQTFTNEKGKEVSYLKNTLDYGICDSSNAGCNWYCSEYDYKNKDWTCAFDSGEKLFFNKHKIECDAEEEGCHKFIKLEEGVNIIYNGGFEDGEEEELELAASGKFNNWPVEKTQGTSIKITKDDSDKIGGDYSYKIETDGVGNGIYSFDAMSNARMANSMMPEKYGFDYSKGYILSADIKVVEGKAEIAIGNSDTNEWKASVADLLNKWERKSVYLPPGEISANKIIIRSFELNAGKSIFYVDNVILEEASSEDTNPYYKSYAYKDDIIFSKKLPNYLDCSDRLNRSAECSDFSRECSITDVGCLKYTPINGEPWIPGIISADDLCDQECVNYRSYKQSATSFAKEVLDVRFIADNPYVNNTDGKACPAAMAGCTEFTNLDELDKGGEAIEYYTHIKHCEKPDAKGIDCSTFYTWQGSDNEGYQLKTYYLQTNDEDKPLQLDSTRDFGPCASEEDAKKNAEYCKEFYDEGGSVSYAIYYNTVSCSENCFPYRKTAENLNGSACDFYKSRFVVNKDVEHKSDLVFEDCSSGGCVCALEIENCVNSGGKWLDKECLYQTMPEESLSCSAQYAQCNEYKGTSGSNIKIVMENDFESGSNDGWQGGIPSNEAVIVGAKSLTSDTPLIKKDTGEMLKREKSYMISFLAANFGSDKNIGIQFNGPDFYAERTVSINSEEWIRYEAGPIMLTGDLNDDEKLDDLDIAILRTAITNAMNVTARQRELADINGDGIIDAKDETAAGNHKTSVSQFIAISDATGDSLKDVYLDNIVLTEITDNYYLIKNSWYIPDKCDIPLVSTQLGCSEYLDSEGELFQLKSFTNLCSEDVIGCRRMVDTQNSESLFEETYQEGNDAEVVVRRDKVVYFVDNPDKYCFHEDKGCQKFGVPWFNNEKTALEGYQGSTYLINDPDKYNLTLCEAEALECGEYLAGNGNTSFYSWFKDPKDKVCEYKGDNWVKIGTEENCPVAYDIDLTIGGISGLQVEVPDSGWAGICAKEQSGCTEYIDPLSNNEPNLIFNGDFERDPASNGPDEWSNVVGCNAGCGETQLANELCCSNGYSGTRAIREGDQTVSLTKKSLYTISAYVKGTGNILVKDCEVTSPDGSLFIDPSGASLSFNNVNYAADSARMDRRSGRFYIDNGGLCKIQIIAPNGYVDGVKVQKTGIYYQIAESFSDKCSSVNPGEGCILVNERNFSGEAYPALTYSAEKAYSKYNDSNYGCSEEEIVTGCKNSANKILKVAPDRVCGKWIEVTEYIEGKASEIGACLASDNSGSCVSWDIETQENRNFDPTKVSLMRDISGLSKVGFDWGANENIEGLWPMSTMYQTGAFIDFNGGFENPIYDANGNITIEDWNNVKEVVDNPVFAQNEGLAARAPEGKSFLLLQDGNTVESIEFSAYGNTDYVISGYINTLNILQEEINSGIYAHFYEIDTNTKQSKKINGKEESLELREGKQWTFLSKKFTSPENTDFIKINVENRGANPLGKSYFDRINIRPILMKKDDEMANSICRVYPEENSLSCKYTEEGIKHEGDMGYCLEYDSSPGDTNICTNWFPVDIIQGEKGRAMGDFTYAEFGSGPLYYCAEAQYLEAKKVTYKTGPWEWTCKGDITCPIDYTPSVKTKKKSKTKKYTGRPYRKCRYTCTPKIEYLVYAEKDGILPYSSSDELTHWYWSNGNDTEMVYHSRILDMDPIEKFMARCSKVVQVATVDGNSKPWVARLDSESDHKVSGLSFNGENYSYNNIDAPYGAIKFPLKNYDPKNWDFTGDVSGNQSLIVLNSDEGVNINKVKAGLPYSCSSLIDPNCEVPNPYYTDKYECSSSACNETAWDLDVGVKNDLELGLEKLQGLFAKSYNVWQWEDTGSFYKKIDDGNFTKLGNSTVCSTNNTTDSFSTPLIVTDMKDTDPDTGATTHCYSIWNWNGQDYIQLSKEADFVRFFPDPEVAEFSDFNCPENFGEDLSLETALKLSSNDYGGYEEKTITISNFDNKFCLAETEVTKAESVDEIEIEELELDVCDNETTDTEHNVDVTVGNGVLENCCEVCVSWNANNECIESGLKPGCDPNGCDEAKITYSTVITKVKKGEKIVPKFEELVDDEGNITLVPDGTEKVEMCYKYKIYKVIDDVESSLRVVACPGGCTADIETAQAKWNPTTTRCANDVRQPDEICAIRPKVAHLKVEDKETENVFIGVSNSILFQFNTEVDENQVPLMQYYIDWGNGDATIAENLKIAPQPINPHSFTYNKYNYTHLAMKYASDPSIDKSTLQCFEAGSGECSSLNISSACCKVKPRVRIKDNWDWCSNGQTGNPCPDKNNKSDWAAYEGWIVVQQE